MSATPYQVMPALAPSEFEALKADIAARGVQVPVEYDEAGNVLDGHHRLRACDELGIRDWPRVIRHGMTEEEKRTHARRLNLDRRHLNQEQRRALIADELQENPDRSNRAIGSLLGVDGKTVASVRTEQVETTGTVQLIHRRVGLDGKTRLYRSDFQQPKTTSEPRPWRPTLPAQDVRHWTVAQLRKNVRNLQRILDHAANASELETVASLISDQQLQKLWGDE